MTINVGKCDECPFKDEDFGVCVHPSGPTDEATLFAVRWCDPPPSWCPLRREAVVVMLNAAALTAGA